MTDMGARFIAAAIRFLGLCIFRGLMTHNQRIAPESVQDAVNKTEGEYFRLNHN